MGWTDLKKGMIKKALGMRKQYIKLSMKGMCRWMSSGMQLKKGGEDGGSWKKCLMDVARWMSAECVHCGGAAASSRM